MKSFLIGALFIILSVENISAQSNYQKFRDQDLQKNDLSAIEFQSHLKKYNFSAIFTCTDNSVVYGFIGDNFQRIRIKFITISKSNTAPGLYNIYGKSMVKNNVDVFYGTLSIQKIRMYKNIGLGADSMYKNSGFKAEGRLIGTYTLSEYTKQKHSGIFKGAFRSDFFIDKNNKICYDSLSMVSDGFSNNQFVGTWTSYKNAEVKICKRGDYRIPNSGDLDIGAGEFSPSDKYLKYGWQSRRDYFLQSGPNYKQAKQIEEAKWWQ